jgi:Zn-dependent protease with chaperone function
MEERILSNKRRIAVGTALYIVMVAGANALFIELFYFRSRYGTGDAASWLAILLLLLLDLAFIVFATQSGMRTVIWASRATPIYPRGFDEVKDTLNDISISSGIPPPELMFIDEDACNAFSLKRRSRSVIFFSHGLIKTLDREELRAVMAHEFAHICNWDANFNAFVTSMWGFNLLVKSAQKPGKIDEKSSPPSARLMRKALFFFLALVFMMVLLTMASVLISSNDPGLSSNGLLRISDLLSSLLPLILYNVLLIVAFGTVMKKLIDPDRDFLADEMAVKWTMYPEALASALRKTEHGCTLKGISFIQGVCFAPPPRPTGSRRISLQLTVEDRVRNLERALHAGIDPSRGPVA